MTYPTVPAPPPTYPSGNNAMGHPVPGFRRDKAYQWVRSLGVEPGEAMGLVNRVAHALEQDRPAIAMDEGVKVLDLTGAYRLMAVLLT